MSNNRIRLLDSSVAQRIAAGEVIERPESIIRELLDNAIDAGATEIEVHITNGGISEIVVMDNGIGMSPEDLDMCCKPHATSKISHIEDLYNLSTLGFRGEALYSIAACAKLKICSAEKDQLPYTLTVEDGIQKGPEPGGSTKGTTITVKDLFFSIPGRKKFLKRTQSEAAACRKTFLNKAIPFPGISFKLFNNGKLRQNLPASDYTQRILQAFPDFLRKEFVGQTELTAGDFSMNAVCSTPDLYRTDRSYIHIYLNNRRIQEYSLLQAVTYGYNEFLPGGSFPYCFLFIEVDPQLVDFNIHPAKREVKIRNISVIHHEIVQMLKSWLHSMNSHTGRLISSSRAVLNNDKKIDAGQKDFGFQQGQGSGYPHKMKTGGESRENTRSSGYSQALNDFIQQVHERSDLSSPPAQPSPPAEQQTADITDSFIYHGQIFKLFLLAEIEDSLILIDQHAAHERIIYQELIEDPAIQNLLIPFVFEPEKEIEQFLLENISIYRDIGIQIQQKREGVWELLSLPQVCRNIQDDIVDFITHSLGNRQEIEKKLYAMISCKAAIKDGDIIDSVTARNLISKSLKLPVKRCPHGRPIWKEISREQLFRDVERII